MRVGLEELTTLKDISLREAFQTQDSYLLSQETSRILLGLALSKKLHCHIEIPVLLS